LAGGFHQGGIAEMGAFTIVNGRGKASAMGDTSSIGGGAGLGVAYLVEQRFWWV